MTTYAITATIVTHSTWRKGSTYDQDWSGSRSVPTFYLDSRVQGIVSAAHAAEIAAQIINALGTIDSSDLNISATPVDCERESAELDYAARLREATELGRQMGANAASWVIDGNTSAEACERILQGIADGDPSVMDEFCPPDLSAQFADDYTLSDLANDLGVSSTDDALDDYANAWSEAASSAFWAEVERIALVNVNTALLH